MKDHIPNTHPVESKRLAEKPLSEPFSGDDWDPIPEFCRECNKEITRFPRGILTHFTLGLARRFPPGTTVCEDCLNIIREKEVKKELTKVWQYLCPKSYQDTRIDHPGFNRQAFDEMQDIPLDQCLVLHGPANTSKTRALFKRVYSSMLQRMSAIVLYPEDIKELSRSQFRKRTLDFWHWHDIVAIDDIFDVGTSESVIELLIDLINRRVRDHKVMICTNHLTSAQVKEDQSKWGNATSAERERLNRLFIRLRDNFTFIHFDEIPSDDGEIPF